MGVGRLLVRREVQSGMVYELVRLVAPSQQCSSILKSLLSAIARCASPCYLDERSETTATGCRDVQRPERSHELWEYGEQRCRAVHRV